MVSGRRSRRAGCWLVLLLLPILLGAGCPDGDGEPASAAKESAAGWSPERILAEAGRSPGPADREARAQYERALAVLADGPAPAFFRAHPTEPTYAGDPEDLAALRGFILDLATRVYGVPATEMTRPTMFATTLLRDLTHWRNYSIGPEFKVDKLVPDSRRRLADLGVMWRYPSRGICGHMSWSLFHVYRSLGFRTARFDVIDGAIGPGGRIDRYGRSHVSVEVWIPALNRFVIQDPTYNYAVAHPNGRFLDFVAARLLNAGGDADLTIAAPASYRHRDGPGLPPDLIRRIRQDYFQFVHRRTVSDRRGEREQVSWQLFPGKAKTHLPANGEQAAMAVTPVADRLAELHAKGMDFAPALRRMQAEWSVAGIVLRNPESREAVARYAAVRLADGRHFMIRYRDGAVVPYGFDELVPLVARGAVPPDLPDEPLTYLLPADYVTLSGSVVPW